MGDASILSEVCDLLAAGDTASAAQCLATRYPFATPQTTRSAWPASRLMRVFLRDGFTDRYFGQRMVFPGSLRAISLLLPAEFPYQRNWKQSETHPAFWELFPTIDHVIPLARGGPDDESNVVTTSMARNATKANWLLQELNWPSERAPVAENWNGLLSWFLVAYERFEIIRSDAGARAWYRAAKNAT